MKIIYILIIINELIMKFKTLVQINGTVIIKDSFIHNLITIQCFVFICSPLNHTQYLSISNRALSLRNGLKDFEEKYFTLSNTLGSLDQKIMY